MISAAAFQAASVSLMMVQSFIAPYLIGLSSFGEQILVLSIVFLIQGVMEPFLQASFNDRQDESQTPNFFIAIISVALVMVVGTSLVLFRMHMDLHLLVMMVMFAALYLSITSLMAYFFSRHDMVTIAVASWIKVLSYVVTLIVAMRLMPGYEIILANLIASATALAYLMGQLFIVAKPRVHIDRLQLHFILGALTYRLPTISFNSACILILGAVQVPAAVIGEFKIFVSALNAGRYFNLVPLGLLQSHIRRSHPDIMGVLKSVIVLRYAFSVTLFTIALVLIFPFAFERAFHVPSFPRGVLAAAPVYLLLQPVSYLLFVYGVDRPRVSLIAPLLASAMLLSCFLGTLQLTGDPYRAFSAAFVSVMICYALFVKHAVQGQPEIDQGPGGRSAE